ncbi:MAG: SulP family inorganic anion transporter [Candidatus Gracilibacteria bacterium]|nr:SulP family inorganic anion transporter [Candidatus Gracilibacteria bacterium]
MKPPSSTERLQFLPVFSVAIVVLTIGAAFGVLVGRGALIGMLSATVMTTFTALIGGSRYGISSPTGPMSAAIAVILMMEKDWASAHHSDIDPIMLMNVTVALAGVILFIMTLFKIHRLVSYVPQLAISGFVNGIAVLIILSQLQSTTGISNWVLLVITFLLSFGASRFCNHYNHLVWKVLASSFGVMVVMAATAYFFNLPVEYLDISDSLNWSQLALPNISLLTWDTIGIISILALELAFIALLDTLLTAVIMDKKTKTSTNHMRELTGQSLSFLGVSLFGGLPGAQSTVPSMMMVEEKNHHLHSKKLLAFYCIILCLIFAGFLQFIPSAVFGGLIIKIALDVADTTSFKTVLTSKNPKRHAQLFLILAVLISTVMISLNLAVIGCTLFFVLWNQWSPKKWNIPDLIPLTQSEGLSDEI